MIMVIYYYIFCYFHYFMYEFMFDNIFVVIDKDADCRVVPELNQLNHDYRVYRLFLVSI